MDGDAPPTCRLTRLPKDGEHKRADHIDGYEGLDVLLYLPVKSRTAPILQLYQEQLALEALYPFGLHHLPCAEHGERQKVGGFG